MKRIIRNFVWAAAIIFTLRMGASFIIAHSAHVQMVKNLDLDPSLIFYTESKAVLKAEKEVHCTMQTLD